MAREIPGAIEMYSMLGNDTLYDRPDVTLLVENKPYFLEHGLELQKYCWLL